MDFPGYSEPCNHGYYAVQGLKLALGFTSSLNGPELR